MKAPRKRAKPLTPYGWTPEKLASLDPKELSRIAVGFVPERDAEGYQKLLAFLARQPGHAPLTKPDAEIATAAWRSVVRAYLPAKYGAAWRAYKSTVRMMLARAEALLSGLQAFEWVYVGARPFPVGVDPAEWVRMSQLLRRINSHIDDEQGQEPLPELNNSFFEAMDLLRSRMNTTIVRLQIAHAAVDSAPGRPKGSAARGLAKSLAEIWEAAGQYPSVSRDLGAANGSFMEFCELAVDLLPAGEPRALVRVTADIAAKACRR